MEDFLKQLPDLAKEKLPESRKYFQKLKPNGFFESAERETLKTTSAQHRPSPGMNILWGESIHYCGIYSRVVRRPCWSSRIGPLPVKSTSIYGFGSFHLSLSR